MLPPQRHHLSRLLLTVLLLRGWTADGAQNGSETEVVSSERLARYPYSRDIVAKEGSSTLIECNVTGAYDDFKWYNPKGALLGEDTGATQLFHVKKGIFLGYLIGIIKAAFH